MNRNTLSKCSAYALIGVISFTGQALAGSTYNSGASGLLMCYDGGVHQHCYQEGTSHPWATCHSDGSCEVSGISGGDDGGTTAIPTSRDQEETESTTATPPADAEKSKKAGRKPK